MESAETTQMPLEPTQAVTPPVSASAAEPTQAITPPVAAPVSADALLSDAEKRRKLESELARMGMTPEEVKRLLAANANSTEPTPRPAATHTPDEIAALLKASASAKAPKKPARPSEAGLQSFAAELIQSKAEAQNKAVEEASAALAFPEFRESTVQEKIQAEPLLREANMLRRRERYAEALVKCREALALTPKDAAALELMGDLLQGVAQIDHALAAYKRATEADPKRALAERKYGDLLMRQQNWGTTTDPEEPPKNAWIAVLLSALFPGAGQFYIGDIGKGVFFLAAVAVFTYLLGWSPLGFPSQHVHKGVNMGLITLMGIAGVLYIAAVADANISARRRR